MKVCVISTQPHLYARPQDVVLTSMLRATVAGYIRILLPAPMQDLASELRRILLSRTWMNMSIVEVKKGLLLQEKSAPRWGLGDSDVGV